MAEKNSTLFPCAVCGSLFHRTTNSKKFCSLPCRLKNYSAKSDDGCIEWTAATAKSGYGALKLDEKVVTAHRAAFFVEHGRWPDGAVLHSCDNKKCINPLHLREGSAADNVADMMARKRHAWFSYTAAEKDAWLESVAKARWPNGSQKRRLNCAPPREAGDNPASSLVPAQQLFLGPPPIHGVDAAPEG